MVVAGDPLQRQERCDIMRRNGAEGSTLDLVVLQYTLNQEYLELRQDGKEKPSSGTEQRASAKG